MEPTCMHGTEEEINVDYVCKCGCIAMLKWIPSKKANGGTDNDLPF